MSALQTPSRDAPAEEWGRLAVAIPDWRWPDGMHDSAPGFVQSRYGIGSTGDVISYAREEWTVYPDPDHWAWGGWMLRLLCADDRPVSVTRMSPVDVTVWRHGLGTHAAPTLGRACIAAAAALGRWPGGEG